VKLMRECDQNRGLRMGERQLCSPQHPPLKYPGWSADDALWDRGDGRSACVGSALSERGGGPYLARHARDLIARRLSRGKPQGAPGRSRSALHSAPKYWARTCSGAESEEPAPGQEKWRSVGGGDQRRRREPAPVRWPCGGRAVAEGRQRSFGCASHSAAGSARPTRRRFRGVGSNMCWRRVRGTGAE